MKIIYAGTNAVTIGKLKDEASFDLIIVENPWCVILQVQTNPSVDAVIVEVPEGFGSIPEFIRFFRENADHRELLFMITPDKTIHRLLFLEGADDVYLPQFSAENLSQRILFLKQYKAKMPKTRRQEHKEFGIPAWKRTVDILFSASAIIILSPLFILIAAAIRLESRGKMIYAAKRVGAGYKIFDFYKFRSMYSGADQKVDGMLTKNQYVVNTEKVVLHSEKSGGTILYSDSEIVFEHEFIREKKKRQENSFFKVANDPRITKIGRIIRNTSMDELPQLFNILKGDMSLVGNRPLPLYEAEMLTTDQWCKRFLAPAGLTGLWQVTKRGNARQMSADERKQLDIEYAGNYSLLLDLKIILKTFTALLQHENV